MADVDADFDQRLRLRCAAGPLLAGLGLGLAFVPAIGLGTGDAQERDGGLASGLMTTAQQIGGAIGIAALITVATNHVNHALRAGAQPAHALAEGFSVAFGIEAAIIAAAGILALVLLRRAGHAGDARHVTEPADARSPATRRGRHKLPLASRS